jgi:adenosylmethionine-8-amino-7-oxononanoate aminotransferase
MYHADILNKLIEVSKKYDVLAIADEVMTGFGRTGKLFASMYMNQLPDIMCFSKGITGGILPLGATTFTKSIEKTFIQTEPVQIFYHGHTFTANPITCNLALASLNVLLDSKTQFAIDRIVKQNTLFANNLKSYNVLQRVQHLGTIVSIEFKVQDSGYLSNIRNLLYNHFLDRGILLRPLGNVLYIIPPYSITEEELNYVHIELIKYIENYSI